MFNPGRGYKNEFRIIAGQWRRRRLKFSPLPGVRPSPDRVRETLFNWLQHSVGGARCLDLFAGSGALGLEALSRGAASVLFVDRERQIVETLRTHLDVLNAPNGAVLQSDALAYLRGPPQAFDIVFLDPPFTSSELLKESADALERYGWLAGQARIYVEYPLGTKLVLPDAWELIRESHAGRVGFALARQASVKLAQD
ncbi:MAG: 16S rRNA (guanine(966)-N(2))-methyltransferase RsmD [Gammaproteobacteria bacterium]